MTDRLFQFKEANRYIPFILIIGIGIGTANYVINDGLNWIQWVIQSLSTSFIIGYTLVVISLNKPWINFHFQSKLKRYLILTGVFFFIGVFATEIEHFIRSLIFRSEQFELFSGGNMYVFNGIIALILGYSFYQNHRIKRKKVTPESHETESNKSNNIDKIPVKQGDNIMLISTDDIIYFEAFDNYSFVYSNTGEKKLCDYSLIFLEKRLDNSFTRVHRKYIVNKSHIKQIKPHLNGRYVIMFNNTKIDSITSSKGYLTTIKGLIKIQ